MWVEDGRFWCKNVSIFVLAFWIFDWFCMVSFNFSGPNVLGLFLALLFSLVSAKFKTLTQHLCCGKLLHSFFISKVSDSI